MTHRILALMALPVLLITGAPAGAQQEPAAGSVQSRPSAAAEDGTQWLSLSGRIVSVRPDGIELSVGPHSVRVGMSGIDLARDGVLRSGLRITATGRMDKSFGETRRFEASSVFVHELNRYVYADPPEKRYSVPDFHPAALRDEQWVALTGTVIQKADRKLVLATGSGTITVDTSAVPDDGQVPWVDLGDRVSVYGEMDDADLFEGREIIASSVVTLARR